MDTGGSDRLPWYFPLRVVDDIHFDVLRRDAADLTGNGNVALFVGFGFGRRTRQPARPFGAQLLVAAHITAGVARVGDPGATARLWADVAVAVLPQPPAVLFPAIRH